MITHPRFILALLFAATPTLTPAYEINPNSHHPENIKRSLKTEYRQFLARLTRPSHEELTRLSLQCAESGEKAEWCNLGAVPLQISRRFVSAAVIHGVRWNDDPNNFFRVGNEVNWFYWLRRAATAHAITDIDPLEYRSHYGDLQFLHGMGGHHTSPFSTRDNVIAWTRFAYDAAAAQISPAATMKDLAPQYTFARFFTQSSKSNWTVRKLFTNVGDVVCKSQCADDITANDEEVASLALGALLHTIQDSLSASHVERISEDGQSRVVAWLDYRQQDPACHSDEDKNIDWLFNKPAQTKEDETKPAIEWGAWVARNAMMQVPWQSIEKPLVDRMFTLATGYRASDAGKFIKPCPEKS
nr:hypothetical protein [uncultured Duganella sp.]